MTALDNEPNAGGSGLARLRRFIAEMTRLVAAGPDEATMLASGKAMLGRLVAVDDWLPAAFAEPHREHYQQYLLYCDPFERFSLVSFVWAPGQRTPVHDHTVWGLIGMLRGAETCRNYAPDAAGTLIAQPESRLSPGEVTAVSPQIGDVHEVANALSDRASISIHAYGANIGAVARHVFDPATGRARPFVSGYAGAVMPNLWDRSTEIRSGLGI
jgi:3-mercaptopropionate dioxygenase